MYDYVCIMVMLYLPYLPTHQKRTVLPASAPLLSCCEPGPRCSVSFSLTGCTFKVASSTRNFKPAGHIYKIFGALGWPWGYLQMQTKWGVPQRIPAPSDERPPFTASSSLTSETFCSAISAISARSSEVPWSSASTDMLKSTSRHGGSCRHGTTFYQHLSVQFSVYIYIYICLNTDKII